MAPCAILDLLLETKTRRKIEFEAGEDHELAFCCAGTMSRLCAGCASQNSVLVVRFTAKFYVWGVFVPPCAGPNPVGFAHWPAVPAKTAYLSCDLTQKCTLTALLCLLVPAQIQLALRTESRQTFFGAFVRYPS